MLDTESQFPEPEFPDSEFLAPQYIDVDDEPEKIWTLRRILLLLIAILVIVSFLTVFYLAPLLTPQPSSPSQPIPTPTTLPLI